MWQPARPWPDLRMVSPNSSPARGNGRQQCPPVPCRALRHMVTPFSCYSQSLLASPMYLDCFCGALHSLSLQVTGLYLKALTGLAFVDLCLKLFLTRMTQVSASRLGFLQ